MHAPGAGIVAAEVISGRTPSIDISRLRLNRFIAGGVEEEVNVI
jgi:glycine/D-amino acid oxidase-like deaminating enzyme